MPRKTTMKKKRTSGPGRTPSSSGPGYTPRVVVKFRDGIGLPYVDRVDEQIEKLKVGAWKKLKERFPGITIRPMFTSVKPDRIRELVDEAVRRDSQYKPPDFFSYFVIDCPNDIDIDELVKTLLSWRSVQTAYFDPPGDDPAVNAADDPRWPNQGYLDPAPDGIDAEYAWGFTGGDGAGQDVIDLERGWTLNHEDLNAHGGALLHGVILDTSRAHGTSVLGEICAVDNNIGCVGIAPNVGSVNAVSYNGSTIPNAIFAAIDNLPFGGALLLEVQIAFLPCETVLANFDAIRLATALGLIVVEAAGNGNTNLNTLEVGGDEVLNRMSGDFRDSGAIMVGAATSTVPHMRDPDSNFGNRIDCYAWGDSVDTTSSNAAAATDLYTNSFTNTSAASPIITGAALVVQGIAEANLGYRFSGFQMRQMLSNPATGTASDNPAQDRIGVMPDLRLIIDDDVIGIAPDVYIRDFVGDVGDPHVGSISASPDIILRPVEEPDPQGAFGEGSGTENSNVLGFEAEAGQDNFIYVRMRNRGGSDAEDVRADIFWSPPATLLTPDLWTFVDSIEIPNVPAGDALTVSDAITWASDDIPAEGHYCFVGLIGNEQDPAPIPADFVDWDNFRNLIRNNNNVTWRNFNVVENEPDPSADPSGFVAMPFLAPGAPDKARRMRLEAVARLPRGARALLEMPAAMFDAIRERVPAKLDRKRQRVLIPLNPHGKRSFGDMLFPAKSRAQLRLLVQIPKENRKAAYEVYVRQLYEEMEVGRITWRLAPKRQRPAKRK